MKKVTLVITLSIIGIVSLYILMPSPIDAVSWKPPISPTLTQEYANNNLLKKSQILAQGKIKGPEDVAIDNLGNIYGGTTTGWIKRIHKDGTVESWVNTHGRPLGMHFDHHQNLIVADAFKGLLSISPLAKITVLTKSAAGIPINFANDVDIADNGKIYFTDASTRWDQKHFTEDLLEARPYGRFLVYDPKTKETKVLLKSLYFANGVALSQHQDFVLINETWRYRIVRYWLKGPHKGTHELFIENLPGFPDGISGNHQGIFWLALPTPRLNSVDKMQPSAWLKNIVAKLPPFLKPKPIRFGFVLGLNESGKVIYNLQDGNGDTLNEITSVEENNGFLYIGSLHNDRIGKFNLKDLP